MHTLTKPRHSEQLTMMKSGVDIQTEGNRPKVGTVCIRNEGAGRKQIYITPAGNLSSMMIYFSLTDEVDKDIR